MGPPSLMVTIGLAATEEEAQEAAEYFSSFPFRPWTRVVETDTVPVTRVSGWMHVPVEGGSMEVELGADWAVRLRGPVEEVCTGELTAGFLAG